MAKWTTAVAEAVSWRGLLASTVGWCTTSVVGRVGGEHVSQFATRRWSESVVRQLGIELVADGMEHVGQAVPAVIVANHCSQLDIPVLGAVLADAEYRWVFKRELLRVPFVGWHLWAAGHIAVDRQRGGNFARMNAKIDDALARGLSVLFFPEGTRSKDGALRAFRGGAFKTAVRTGLPVLPVVLDGTEHLLQKGSIAFPAGRKMVRVRVLPPVTRRAEGDDKARTKALQADVRAAMVAALDALRGAAGAAERPTLAD